MISAKVGHFLTDRFVEIASGSEEYCRGFVDAYNLSNVFNAVLLVGDACQCGPLRRELRTPADETFLERTGCMRCDRWDGPVRLRHCSG